MQEPSAPKPPSAVVAEAAPGTMKVATIKEIRRAVLPDAVRITIELDGEVPFHDERIPDPARVFVDLPGTRAAPPLVDQTLRFEGDADIVRQVRIGRHPGNLTRIVLDAVGVTTYSVYPLYSPYRLVVDCVRAIAARPTVASDDDHDRRACTRRTAHDSRDRRASAPGAASIGRPRSRRRLAAAALVFAARRSADCRGRCAGGGCACGR